jgi:cytochrome c556
MMMSSSAFGALKAQASADDLKRANFPAHALAGWARAIPAMFPEGTDIPPSDALPALWSDRAGFNAAAEGFVVATTAVNQAVAANDKVAYRAALDQVGKACSACHDKYRKPEEKH